MRDRTYGRLRRVCHLPLVRNVTACLYHSRRWKSLECSGETAWNRLHAMCPPPESCACWEMPDPDACEYDVSVIIPFYNTERYAVECIESVLNQVTDYRMEVILVDDGSPDGCGEILDHYAARDHVRVIHQVNQGLSMARNAGLAAAKGRYVTFLDSDDYFEQGAIQTMMRSASDHRAQISEGSLRFVSPDGSPRRSVVHTFSVGSRGTDLFGYSWGKVFQRSLFKRICFPKGYWYEDAIITHLIYPLAETTVMVEPIVMNYRNNPASISRGHGGNPRTLHALYISRFLLETMVQEHYPLDLPCRERLLRELGPMVLSRTQGLGMEVLKDIFAAACDLTERYDLTKENAFSDPMLNELCEAFRRRQFYRWLWTSFLL